MRFTRLTPLAGAVVLTSALGAGLLAPSVASADEVDTLAATPVAGELCDNHAPTFDEVVSATASAIRTLIPAAQLAAYDQQVEQTRQAMAQLPVHRDLLPVNPATLGGRVDEIDDPFVTQIVADLDAIRTGRLDHTTPLSTLSVNDVVEIFIMATRIVKIPAQFLAGSVPTFGFVLSFVVGGIFSGIKWLARKVQDAISGTCALPSAYPKLDLNTDDFPVQHVAVPAELDALAHQLNRADGQCTPVADLKLSTVVDRARAFVAATDLPLDKNQATVTADQVQAFLANNRISDAAVMQRPDQLGSVIDFLNYGPLTFLANLGFEIGNGTVTGTTALADVTVENAYDLAALTLDTIKLLTSAAALIPGTAAITGPLGSAETYAYLPYSYGSGPLLGVMQSMCAV
ncbi:hypothetical protein [Nocardia stercoris]|uniref:Uncharacterized protein n=1 Tax=Nocardia stercoris TaxID=2483361 RepID=A0A3M2L9D0_9NOCA|nr:hypothetical protein [Nocardia stercoris]RMI34202.1 hypothetical protein EBN03_07230 [Nocardia stercoris]